jgi:hypothetical protein
LTIGYRGPRSKRQTANPIPFIVPSGKDSPS